ncbi:MAG: hypothetical protein NZ992_00930 [Candidatus Korarchaeum sp.]|nr:hypothetical protein [Candidatus Korarchaeum sp.]MDW8035402.1 hypothetical protein [Candidatus Korarchaeum sp.]
MPKNLPLTHLIYEILKERTQIDDQELYEILSSKVQDISLSDVEKALLKLEVMGKIIASSSGKKGGLLIELAAERKYVTPDEE